MVGKPAAEKKAWVDWSIEELRPIRFKGALLHAQSTTSSSQAGFAPLTRRTLADAIYDRDQSVAKSMIDQVLDTLESVADDWTDTARYIGFHDKVWDATNLQFVDDQLHYVYASCIALNDSPRVIAKVRKYLLDLADGDEGLARDYLQMVAPLFMTNRPVGVIWALGAGANGKSSFLNILYRIFPNHLTGLTVEMIEDGRATPALRGTLGNIVRESSEKRVDDTAKYKNIGAHEPFPVRVLGTHDTVMVDTNFHSIFSANNLPVFADKTMGSRRRTLLVPFPATFADNPNFDDDTFTPEFLGAFVHLVLEETHSIAEHGYQWSKASKTMQDRYNQDANTAEAYAHYLDELGIVAFKNYHLLRLHYETWCSGNGTVPLGRTHLTRAIENVLHPVAKSYRDEGVQVRRYFLESVQPDQVTWWSNGYGTKKDGILDGQRKEDIKEEADAW